MAAAIQASLSQNTGRQISTDALSDDSDVDILSDNDTDDEEKPATPMVKVSTVTDGSASDAMLITDVENNTINQRKQNHELDEPDDNHDNKEEGEKAHDENGGGDVTEDNRHWTDYLGSAEDEKSQLLIRFPDGKREKKDLPCSSPFIVSSQPVLLKPEYIRFITLIFFQAIIKYVIGEGYGLDSHEIVTNFPRRVLTDLEDSKSLKDLGLFPKETIFIQQKS